MTSRNNLPTDIDDQEIAADAVDEYANYEEPDETQSAAIKNVKKRTIVLLALCAFCYGLNCSLYGPFFTQKAEEKGLSPHDFGLIFGSYHLTTFFFIPVIGIWVQTVSIKFILSIGMFLAGSCTMIFGLLELCAPGTPFTSLAYAVRVLDGFGGASFHASIFAIVTSQFASTLWTKMVILEIFVCVGYIIGPLLGGVLYDFYCFSLPFYCFGTLTMLLSVLVFSLLPAPSEIKVKVTRAFWSVFKVPRNLLYFLGLFSASYYSGMLEAVLQSYLKEFQLREIYIGSAFLTPALVHALMAYVWKLSIKTYLNSVMMLVVSCCVLVASVILMMPEIFTDSHKLRYVVIGLALKGLGQSIKYVCSYHGAFSDSVFMGLPNNEATHNLIFGMYMFAITSGYCVGAFSSGYMYERIGFKLSILVPLAMEVFAIPFLIVYVLKRNYKRPVLLSTADERRPLLSSEPNES